MTYSINGKLKPVIGHSSAIVDNRYLAILGGYTNVDDNESERSSGYESLYKYYSLYNLTVFDTFTNDWENINIEPDIMDTSKVNIQFKEFLSTADKNKVYILAKTAGEDNTNAVDRILYLGILDYSSKTWNWSPIYDEDGGKYNSSISANDLVVYKDQIIIINDNTTSTYDKVAPILVLDLITKRMKSTLRSSYRSNVKDSDSILPPYAIVLIGVGCTALLPAYISLLYLINKKKSNSKNTKNNHSDTIPEVWSNPDIDNTNNIITWDKKKGINIKQNSSNTLYFNRLFPKSENQNTSNMIEIS
ncbi:hypothetical protein CONCODRAFT_12117 [Conidiobolus coronatus NRRL 28638]|uniref:Galactose oxidase n=1 Tax=Conidiobolus coronatus (strain ATCC 28846 / CBS 209.66 / NRRL 28638) TaxID=796925 RepID=A0A137NTQ2_CONC2|nr:hypothetical protein CONCODRAFT_12117 [Conidiobolus coronatus NRRL 28638]|eukprot:KXN66101.1 hypothetical protein CONCODRAFT_12117 [Conidiobolus coronatus NRRL 28638]